MMIYMGRLILHESLYFATREVGRLYETGRYLHNYALTYALGLAVAPYFNAEQVPRYAEQLTPLNEQGVYVTTARGSRWNTHWPRSSMPTMLITSRWKRAAATRPRSDVLKSWPRAASSSLRF